MIYLDNSATTKVLKESADAAYTCMQEDFFNPSAMYAPSARLHKEIQDFREELKKKLSLLSGQVVFVSGGTEADNLAVLGGLKKFRDGTVLYSAGEHSAVREACIHSGLNAKEIPLTPEGIVDLEALSSMMDSSVRMICVMQVNNEVGAVQPLEEIGKLKKRFCPQACFHVDGVQGFLRVPFSFSKTGADSYALSGHKIGAPKGIGALVFSDGLKPAAALLGGGQENGYRSGTENTPGILALRAAIRAYPGEYPFAEIKKALWHAISDAVPQAHLNGPVPESVASAPHILNVSFPPVRSQTLLHALEAKQIYVGAGSACASSRQKISRTLAAMHVASKWAESALRFSLGTENTLEEIPAIADALKSSYELLRPYTRR